MSLRAEGDRGYVGRSHSRIRDRSRTRDRSISRDGRGEDSSRTKRSSHRDRSVDSRETRDEPARQPSTKAKGLSSLLSAAPQGIDNGGVDSRHDSHVSSQHNRSHSRDARTPRDDGISSPLKSEIKKSAMKATPYPSSDSMMPQYPVNHLDSSLPKPYAGSDFRSSVSQEETSSRSEVLTRGDDQAPQPPKARKRGVSFAGDADEKDSVKERIHMPTIPQPKPERLSINTDNHNRAPSPGLDGRMDRLSVSGNRPELRGLGPGQAPPASPLLEAYHGTYQSMPAMSSPMMLPDGDVDDLPPLTPLPSNQQDERSREKTESKAKKRVKLYDSEGDADKIAKALNRQEANPDPLIDILPEVTHDQLLALRKEYKNLVKMGGKGVSLSKHIKATTTGNFGKACFVTSLGRWESESYWANFWYQSHSSSRELLIEALMGRSNADIREIKDSFSDKRYDDNLAKCMEKELKPDKFLMAVLLALEAHRQEETDIWPVEYRNKDIETLRKAILSREGGETAIIEIVVRRSDKHLRDVLKSYQKAYHSNFAKDALKKSNNLVVSHQ